MDTAITKQLTDLISSVLSGKPIPEGLLWEEIFPLAKEHNLAGFLYLAAKSAPDVPEGIRAAIEKTYYAALGQQTKQEIFAREIFSALDGAGIRYLAMKGYCLRKLYPRTDLRFSCDLDFFYEKENTRAVRRIMRDLGYTLDHTAPHHDEFSRERISVEPHRYLALYENEAGDYYRDIWDRLIPEEGGCGYRFSDEDFYIYMLLHMHKHMTEHGGVGIRSLVDVFVYLRAKPDLDRAYLAGEFSRLRIVRFVASMEHLASVWFGGAEETPETRLLTNYVAESGTYGNVLHAVAASGADGENAKSRYFFRRLFPPYRVMRGKYPVLVKWRILLPLMWVIRAVSAVFSPRRRYVRGDLDAMKTLTPEMTREAQEVMRILKDEP